MESASVVLWGFTVPFCAIGSLCLARSAQASQTGRSSPSAASLHPLSLLPRRDAQQETGPRARHVGSQAKPANCP